MNKKNDSFTVVIPTYNHADFLKEALQSVIDQKYKNYKVFICYDKIESLDYLDKYVFPI